MFKKFSEVKAHQRLSGADRKKLRRSIRDKFIQASDADLDLILPAKAEISVARLANRTYVYTVEGGPPMLFDVDGRGNEIFPTVYALWKVPSLLPAFMLKGAEVSRYVLGGADLMFPGVDIPSEGLPPFAAGEPWAIKVPGNAAPIAVGTTVLSSSEALKAGLRGKALRVVHYYRDSLWESAEGCHVPNEGFLEDMVRDDPTHVKAGLEQAEPISPVEVDGRSHDEVFDGCVSEPPEVSAPCQETDLTADCSPKLPVKQEGVEKVPEILASETESLRIHNDTAGDTEAVNLAITADEMDALLDRCLLQALHTSVKEKDLPMSGSTLWSNHILPCRPSGTMLDFKKSSHKKLSKWLQAKSSIGLISAKEDKHRKEAMLLGINRVHPEYMKFKPAKKTVVVSAEPSSNDQRQAAVQLEVLELWKPTTHVSPVFQMVGADPNKLYSTSESSEVAFAYVEKETLVKASDKAVVVLDALLCDALYKGTVKKGSSYPTEIHKKDLGSTFVGRMQAHSKVCRGNESIVRKGALRTVQIMTERRQGSKKVTRVSGFDLFLVDADMLANELQKKFACSTSVAELPGKKGQYEVLVQGGVLEDLGRYLVQHYGIPKKYIEILDKTKK